MPTTYNTIGTWYWGKSRIHTIHEPCSFCHRFADLQSYDTTLYFVILHIPLIPLGKRRVLEQCACCKRHRSIKLAEWERLKQQAISESARELRADHDSPDTVVKALGVAASFQDENLFLNIAEHLADPMSDDAEVQAALGGTHFYFSRFADAERALRISLDLRENQAVRDKLALALLKQSLPADAERVLQKLVREPDPARIGFLVLLAEGYQSVGNHARALELCSLCSRAQPEIAADSGFRKLRALSEKHLQSGKPIASQALRTSKKAGYVEGGRSARLARVVGPVIALALIGVYLVSAWYKGEHREAILVNGLPQPYAVLVNGKKYELKPRRHQHIEVREGDVTLAVDDAKLDIPKETVLLETRFWSRPFTNHTFVLNPDRVAVIAEEEQYYGEQDEDVPPPKSEIHVGNPLYEFRSLDYEFLEFPDQIQKQGSGNVAKRTRVALVNKHDADEPAVLALLAVKVDKAVAKEFIKRRLSYDPNGEILVFYASKIMEPDEYVDFLRTRLGDRPVLVQWHRAYQTAIETQSPDHDLEAEYKELLDADQENKHLIYLLGRVTQDLDQAESLFRRSIEGDEPCAFGYGALAYSRLSSGRFDEALELARQAESHGATAIAVTKLLTEIYLALGRYDDLLVLQQRESSTLNDAQKLVNTVRIQVLKEDVKAAEAAIDAFCTQMEMPPRIQEAIGNHFRAEIAYSKGDGQAYLEAAKAANDENPDFVAWFSAGKLEEAAAALEQQATVETGGSSWVEEAAVPHLLLYIAGAAGGKSEFAHKHLESGIAVLRKGDGNDRRFADALSADARPDSSQLLRASILPEKKRVLLAALGTRFPEDRDAYFELARRLNYDPGPPHLFIKNYLHPQEQAEQQAAEGTP